MDQAERAKRFELARVGLNQNGKETKNAVYEKTGVPSSALCAYEDPKSTRALNLEYVEKLAVHYGVNIGWLLGQSESWSTKNDIRQACEATGLSPDAVWALQALTKDEGKKAFINAFIASEEFAGMIGALQTIEESKDMEFTTAVVDYTKVTMRESATEFRFGREDLKDLEMWRAERKMSRLMERLVEMYKE